MSAEVESPASPASPSAPAGGAPAATTTWRYIGLCGHSVGTLSLDAAGLTWRSTSRPRGGGGDDEEDVGTTRRVAAKLISTASWTVFGRSGYLRVTTKTKDGEIGKELRFDGFPERDYSKLANAFDHLYGKRIGRKNVSCSGASFGVTDIHDKNLVFRESLIAEGEEGEAESGEEIVSLDLTEVTQCVLPGNNRNEIELQFHETDAAEQNTDQLVQIRFYVPPDPDTDPTDKESLTAAELFQQRIVQRANIKSTTGNVIAKFDEVQGTFLTPRGRYTIELYDRFLRLRGNKYDYKIRYDDISRLFLLPKPDEVHMAFVIALDKPIRQGQQRYQYLVMQTTKAQSELTIHLDEETLEKEYGGDLQPVMQGSLSNLVAKTFKVVTGKKVFVPGKFANANQYACVKCALRANEGHLYPLEKQFIFIHKPSVLIRFDEVESVEFQRYAGGQGSTRNFDLCVALRHGAAGGADGQGPREYVFSGIDRSDYAALYSFLSGKKIRIKNLEGMDPAAVAGGAPPALLGEMTPAQATAQAMAMMEDDDDEESEDEDYESGEASSGSEPISDDGEASGSDDDDDGSVSDSDLEEYRNKAKEQEAKAAKKRKAGDDGGDDEDGGDDFIVDDEGDSKKKKKPKKKGREPKAKKAKAKAAAAPAKKAKKAKKDPNAPKKNLTSFMLFSNARRATVKEDNPDASFGELGKLIGAEWKKLTDEEKKEFIDKSAEDKVRYEKAMVEYEKTKKDEGGGDGGASDDDDGGSDDGSSKKKKKKKKKEKKEKKKKSKKSKEKAKPKAKSKSKKKKREASSDEGDSEEEASADSMSSGDDSD